MEQHQHKLDGISSRLFILLGIQYNQFRFLKCVKFKLETLPDKLNFKCGTNYLLWIKQFRLCSHVSVL